MSYSHAANVQEILARGGQPTADDYDAARNEREMQAYCRRLIAEDSRLVIGTQCKGVPWRS